MKPVDQTKLHIPNKQRGNCMCAALASLLEFDINDVPKFNELGEYEWYPKLLDWLWSLGFYLICWDCEVYLPVYFIAIGTSIRGFTHSVVYYGEKMVHDPHPSRAGLEKVTSVWVLLPLDPAKYKRTFNKHPLGYVEN
uniref:Uncharacterized protein n=1 Tax=viral metagenome TaxID=1070528 RepID=A0A6M3KUW1_9ZZZZ